MKIFVTVFLLFVSAGAIASGKEASGNVQLFAVDGEIILQLSGSNSSCGSRYYFKPDTDYNRALLSMLLSAQMSNKQVWVNGSGNCIETYPKNHAYKLENMTIYN
ncbi:hypothetical protein KCG43_14715 [Photobacterium sp. WH24]|uniref:hypothetical protein n=1 Tax=Photobacterium sp. WH24 TaxID=2827237 RepID=UPI001C457A11|nr:hypothetical protein [Photobacterium sp. WH24]MBV7263256.1 hypothetical protein [Photobacterium sp. WH24]